MYMVAYKYIYIYMYMRGTSASTTRTAAPCATQSRGTAAPW